MCTGLIEQIEADRKGQFFIASVDVNKEGDTKRMATEAESIKEKYKTVEEDNDEELETAWDDVSGAELDPKVVRKARGEEIEYVRKMNLCSKVSTQECYARIGKAPIIVRWIDINKGGAANPNYRSRFVAREINTHKRDDLFAGTPPLEVLKSILSITATGNKGEVVMVNDVSRAFFHAKVRREVYVQLVAEDIMPGDENKCGRLNYSMYGTRDAAQNWSSEYAEVRASIGFTQGKATPCVFEALELSCTAATTLVQPCQGSWNGSRDSSRTHIKQKHNGWAPGRITQRKSTSSIASLVGTASTESPS